MTKSVVEQFAEIIEMLILAIEAQINGAPLPNRMAASMAAFVRKSLEKLNASVANAIARVMAGALPPPPVAPRAASEARQKSPKKPLTWSQRFGNWLPGCFKPAPLPPLERPAPRSTRDRAPRSPTPARPHRGEAPSSKVQTEPPAASRQPHRRQATCSLGNPGPPPAPPASPIRAREASGPQPNPKFFRKTQPFCRAFARSFRFD